MKTYNITELTGRTIKMYHVDDLNMTLAKDIDTEEVFEILPAVVETEKKKPGPKKKYSGNLGRPKKNIDYIPGSKSKDFLSNDKITSPDDDMIDELENEINRTKTRLERKFDLEDSKALGVK